MKHTASVLGSYRCTMMQNVIAVCLFPLSLFFLQPPSPGMLPVLLLAGLILALSIPGTASESATLRFLGQTEFVVNESSTAVVRLVVERVGDPVNVTALVLVRHRKSPLLLTRAPHKQRLQRMQKNNQESVFRSG